MKELLMIKLGGSLLTNKSIPNMVRSENISRLSQEIKETGKKNIILAHGGGSFPHPPAKKYAVHKGIESDETIKGICEVQDAASRLNRIIVSNLMKAGINAMSIQPSACALSKDSRIIEWNLSPIKECIKNKIIPVPYGDVMFDKILGCSIVSTEEILFYLTKKFQDTFNISIIIATDVDGVLDNDRNVIEHISIADSLDSVFGSSGIDVTGGMRHKVERMLEVENVNIQIINGAVKDRLRQAMLGEEVLGTKIG